MGSVGSHILDVIARFANLARVARLELVSSTAIC